MASADKIPDMGRRVLWGFLLTALCLFLALSLFSYDWRDISVLQAPPSQPPVNLFGPVGAWTSFALFMTMGLGAFLVPWVSLALGIILILNRQQRVWPRLLWGVVVLAAVVALMQLDSAHWSGLCQKLNIWPDAGGLLGRLFMKETLERWLSPFGSGSLISAVLVLALVMTLGPRNVWRGWLGAVGLWRSAGQKVGDAVAARQDRREQIEQEARQLEKQRRRLERAVGGTRAAALGGASIQDDKEAEDVAAPARTTPERRDEPRVASGRAAVNVANRDADQAEEAMAEAAIPARDEQAPTEPKDRNPLSLFGARRKERKAEVAATVAKDEGEDAEVIAAAPASASLFTLPPIDLLAPVAGKRDGIKADTNTTARILVETLQEFGIEGQITNVEVGPVVTNYELLPAPGVKVERISGLSNNLALSLKATSVRVQAPIPGKGVVGIEVPNEVSLMVPLREVLESEAWKSGRARLPLALGKDVTGADLVVDLATMPHLLIAGATGAGKSVCMNSILAGLLMTRTPEQLRLMLVDPKRVEFSVFNRLPHLVVPVINEAKKVGLGLRWAINEMERRYKLFARVGVRNIEGYNSREIVKQEDLFGDMLAPAQKSDEPPARVPYIVIVIDELADLMMNDQSDIENNIARLAQLSRAVGIHMIIATQRPSVNVITGTIKANFPARIAFQVAQKNDSRIILDSMGAEKLLGRGDMLFMPPGSSRLVRAQGAMCSDAEIRAIAEFARAQGAPSYEVAIHEKIEKADASDSSMDGEEDEDMLAKAVEIIRETRRASTSSLQRRLRIGYTRAARVIDVLEERGILGPPRGAEPREILIDLDGEIPNNTAGEDGESSQNSTV